MNDLPAPESPENSAQSTAEHHAPLGLWDAVALIVGIVIGTTIFRMPHMIFSNVAGPTELFAAWIFGGILSLAGALCFAELVSLFPRSGGDYHYLTHSYGRWSGFLFGWVQLTFVQPTNIAAMAFAFATYGKRFLGHESQHEFDDVLFASVLVIVLTALNLIGVHFGKWMQNILALVKATALLLILFAACFAPTPTETIEPLSNDSAGFGFALLFVLFAMGGWNDAALVASEVKDRERQLPRALWMGLGIVTGLYLLVNLAYWRALGFENVRHSDTPAADVLSHLVGDWGTKLMSALVMISALGTVNGLIFSISRLHAAVGTDHPLLGILGHWNHRLKTPVIALVIQGAITLIFIATSGLKTGRDFIDQVHHSVGLNPVNWQRYFGGFETMVAASAPLFWLFFLAVGLAVFIHRVKYPQIFRPFRIPCYPIPPLLFCGMCLFMLHSAITYAWSLLPMIAVPLITGLVAFQISESLKRNTNKGDYKP